MRVIMVDTGCIKLTKKDIEDTKELAERLKGGTKIDTVINILEWQDQNINYWHERYKISIITLIEVILAFLLIYFIIQNINKPLEYILLSGIIGAIIGNITYIYLKYSHLTKKKGFMSNLSEILTMIWKTFGINITIFDILNYRLAICRDYAKLTSAILHNLNIEHYFVFINRHVAVAVKVKDTYYVIDQKFPLWDINTWIKKHRNPKIYTPNKDNSKLSPVNVEVYELKNKITDDVLKKIEVDVKNELRIDRKKEGTIKKSHSIKLYRISKGDGYDNVIHHSLVRYIVNEIKNEFLTNYKNISSIKLKFDENNCLTVNIEYVVN